jgi:F-type H+-transporting ATPase subunit b
MLATSIFLLPNGTFFVELVVFIVLLLIARRYFVPPIVKAMENRQEKVRASLAAAEAARAEAAQAADERALVLAEARDQARQIVAAAMTTSDQVKSEAVGRAQAEYDRIVAGAQVEVEAARQRAVESATASVGELVFDLVAKVVGREVDQSAHDELIREAIAALRSEAARGSDT